MNLRVSASNLELPRSCWGLDSGDGNPSLLTGHTFCSFFAGPWMAGCRCPIGRGSLMLSTAACGDGPTCTATMSYEPWSSVSSPST